MSRNFDVVISGGGPVGLFLACELAMRSISTVVLEKDAQIASPWKVQPLGSRGFNTLSIESLYRRGMLDKFPGLGTEPTTWKGVQGRKYGGNFAGLFLDASQLELSRWKYVLDGPALFPGGTSIDYFEGVLSERAESLGVTILRDHAVTKIDTSDEQGVTVTTQNGESFHGKWLVGCDGGHSAVRKLDGFTFAGTEPTLTGYCVHCEWDHPEKVKPGFNVTETGLYIKAPEAIYLVEFDKGAQHGKPVTHEHLQAVFDRVTGIEGPCNITKIHIAQTFTDRAMQTTEYRRGRVIVAGDAAHINSPIGAQGLNTGIADAMNLGWKLAKTIQREKDTASSSSPSPVDLQLLDSYSSERYPLGTWVVNWTRVQVATMRPDANSKATHALLRDLINTTDGANLLMGRVWGLSHKYELETTSTSTFTSTSSHPVVGRSAPDFEFHGGTRLGARFEKGRGLLVVPGGGNAALEELVGEKMDVDCVCQDVKDTRGLQALLVRPDGVVAWAVDDGEEVKLDEVKNALERWF